MALVRALMQGRGPSMLSNFSQMIILKNSNKWPWTSSTSRFGGGYVRNFCNNSSSTITVNDHYNEDDDPLMVKEEFEVGSQLVSFKTGDKMRLRKYHHHIRPRSCLTNKWSNREAVIMDMGGESNNNNKLLAVVKVGDEGYFDHVKAAEDGKRILLPAVPRMPPITDIYVEKPFLDAQELIHSAQHEKFPSRTLLQRPRLGKIINSSISRLFPDGYYRNNVLASMGVVKSDGKQDPIIMAANAMSAALMLSDITWGGPVGVVRIGRMNGEFVVNPAMDQMISGNHDLDLVYACTRDTTLMIELQANEVSDNDVEAALRLAHHEAEKYIEAQIRLAERAGKLHNKKDYRLYLKLDHIRTEVENKFKSLAEPKIEAAIDNHLDSYRFYGDESKRKLVSDEIIQSVVEEAAAQPLGKECSNELVNEDDIERLQRDVVDKVMKNVIRSKIMENGLRVDGRRLDEAREFVYSECGNLPVYNGSSIFWLGNTQVLSRVTLFENKDDCYSDYCHEAEYENLDHFGLSQEHFLLLNFSFPYISTRDEKDFVAVLPPIDHFPYKVRVEVDVMASSSGGDHVQSNITYTDDVCVASLALMDAGIPIKRHVAGVAMGLVSDTDPATGIIKDHRILTDIDRLDLELGDMYLKIAGTRKGVTAMRLEDVRALAIGDGIGIPLDIICECFEPALKARLRILDHMEREIDAPRRTSPDFIDQNGRIWRTCSSTEYNKGFYNMDFLRSLQLIGPTPTEAEHDQATALQTTTSTSTSTSWKEKAQENVVYNLLTRRGFEVGKIYEGVVSLIREKDGAFVEILDANGGKRPLGFLPISEMLRDDVDEEAEEEEMKKKISRLMLRVSLGQQLTVKCIDYDTRGFFKLSSLKSPTPTPVLPPKEKEAK